MISIVIPLYNKAPFVERAIHSALAQEGVGGESLEVVVIDDGSTDGGADIVAKMEDARIRLTRQPNSGASAARNAGADAARGDLIAFLDADDEWKPNKLARELEAFASRPSLGALACQVEYAGKPRAPGSGELLVGEAVARKLRRGVALCSSTIIVRRDAWYKAGGFRTDLAVAEDWEFEVRLFGTTETGILDERLVIVHEQVGSLSSMPLRRAGDIRRAFDLIFRPERKLFKGPMQMWLARSRAMAVFEESCALEARDTGQLAPAILYATRAAAHWPPLAPECFRVMAVALLSAARGRQKRSA